MRAQTAQEIHKREWHRSLKARGLALDPASRESWEQWKEEYGKLSDETLTSLENRALASKIIAKQNRRKPRKRARA